MPTTYAQKQAPAQKKDASSASSVLDSSPQSESLQRKADMANNAAQRAEAPRPNNTGMPDNLKAGIESLSGFSMDDVRVHYNSSKPATVQALAYTQGTDIHVAPGQEKCLPHEAWHVAQQMAGRVSPTTNINGMPVNDNAGLEHEADVMGEKAVQGNNDLVNNAVQRVALSKIVQRDPLKDMLYEERKEVIQDAVNRVMTILRERIQDDATLLDTRHGRRGRDAFFYDFWNRNESLLKIVNEWTPEWNYKKTCGLLLDLGLALMGTGLSDEFASRLMSREMEGGRDSKTHRVNEDSTWAADMEENGLHLQCGPSATTCQLLKVLHALHTDLLDIESIMIGVIHYWNDSKIRRIIGNFHTAAEVWSAYSFYLEQQVYRRLRKRGMKKRKRGMKKILINRKF